MKLVKAVCVVQQNRGISPCSLDGSKLDFNVDIHVELGTGVFDENGNPVNNWIEPKGMVKIKPDSRMI